MEDVPERRPAATFWPAAPAARNFPLLPQTTPARRLAQRHSVWNGGFDGHRVINPRPGRTARRKGAHVSMYSAGNSGTRPRRRSVWVA
jgi:hypothetical protein